MVGQYGLGVVQVAVGRGRQIISQKGGAHTDTQQEAECLDIPSRLFFLQQSTSTDPDEMLLIRHSKCPPPPTCLFNARHPTKFLNESRVGVQDI